MTRIKAGGGRPEDLTIMRDMAQNMGIMPGTTICGLADGAAWPVRNALDKFRPEFEEYIRLVPGPNAGPTPLQEAITRGEYVTPTNLVALSAPNHAVRELR